MCKQSATHLLETLGQVELKPTENLRKPLIALVLNKRNTLKNTMPLIDLDSPMKKAYWSSYYCGNVLLQEGKKISSQLCRARWCIRCNRIKTAELINGYKHLLNDFIAPHLVVVTMKNCKGRGLKSQHKKMNQAFQQCRWKIDRKHGIKINGIRTWECTYNIQRDDYHPHFNVLIDSSEGASLFLRYWMEYWQKKQGFKSVNRGGQSVSKIESVKGLLEVFKYTTKLSVSHEEEYKAQDWIYQCVKGKRLAQPFGNLRKVKIAEEKTHQEEVEALANQIDIWAWEKEYKHYVNSWGETLVAEEEVEALESELKEQKQKNKYKPKHEERYKPK